MEWKGPTPWNGRALLPPAITLEYTKENDTWYVLDPGTRPPS